MFLINCLVVQNFKIPLTIIEFIVDLLKTLVALKKAVLKKLIFALILDAGEMKTVRIFFYFLNSLFQGYQSFQKIYNESVCNQRKCFSGK